MSTEEREQQARVFLDWHRRQRGTLFRDFFSWADSKQFADADRAEIWAMVVERIRMRAALRLV